MNRYIVVSSNCQTAGIAASLKEVLPGDHIVPVPAGALDAATEARLREHLRNADVWITTKDFGLAGREGVGHPAVLKIPEIFFRAFHPDICVATIAPANQLTEPHYNSAIAAWAYKNRLTPTDASQFYSRHVFTALGYLNRWQGDVAVLRERFAGCDLDFNEFYLSIKRAGVFMHSLNHPKIAVLSWLAKKLAVKLGESASILYQDIPVPDGLNRFIWPVYPEIGDELSVPSSYNWHINGKWISGLQNYLDYAYQWYADQDIAPENLQPHINEALYNRVLGSCAGLK
jgi:hypothetical protein